MESKPTITPTGVDAQIEEIRTLLRSVYRTLTGAESAPSTLEELIKSLLNYGVTRREIAFLFSEALIPIPMKITDI